MLKPDYQGGSLVNLMQSLRAVIADGGEGPTPGLQNLDAGQIESAKHIVLLVVDGLGCNILDRFPTSELAAAPRQVLTSVFPTTTATAITTLMTAQAPQQHGITGWYMWLREAGVVSTILPFITRVGGVDLREMGVAVDQVVGTSGFFDRIKRDTWAYLPEHIVNSTYSACLTGRASRVGYSALDQLLDVLVERLQLAPDPSFSWVYWPELDSTAHHEGLHSDAFKGCYQELERFWEGLVGQLAGTDTLVLLTADHGHIDTSESRHVRLQRHPELQKCLTLPLCGEPRAPFCYVHPQQQKAFERYVSGELARYCDLLPSHDLFSQGYFGDGEPHPALMSRIGDYTLLMKENYVMKDTLAGEKLFTFAGVHGGLSQAEMEVPLIVQAL